VAKTNKEHKSVSVDGGEATRLDRALQAQLFGPLSIYNIQQKSERLARDLSNAFFPNKEQAFEVVLALRDGCTEEQALFSDEARLTRFYRPGFINRYSFLTDKNRKIFEKTTDNPESSSVFGWIQWYCKDTSLVELEGGKKDDVEQWKTLVSQVEKEKSDRWPAWGKPQSAQEAFEHIASVFSHSRYSALTPGKLDDLCWKGNPTGGMQPSYPMFHIAESTRGNDEIGEKPSITGQQVDLYRRSFRPQSFREVLDEIRFADGTEPENIGSKNLFLRFLDPFFLGADKPSDESFVGLALPLYDRWGADGPIGAFVGWVFMIFQNEQYRQQFFEDLLSEPPLGHLRREILRANFNDYAESLAEHVMDEEIAGYNPAKDLDPSGYFRTRFKYIEGWTVEDDDCGGLKQGMFFAHEVSEDGFGRLRVSLDDHSARCALLKPKYDTLLPHADDDNYFERVSIWARTFWQGLQRLASEHQFGLAKQAQAQFGAVGHELVNIVPAIPSAPKWLLEAIQAWLLTYSLPAFTKLNDAKKTTLPQSLIGGDNPKTHTEWLHQLIDMAAQVEVLVIPGKSGIIPMCEDAFKKSVAFVSGHFCVTNADQPPPSDWTVRCYLGVVYLCAIRKGVPPIRCIVTLEE